MRKALIIYRINQQDASNTGVLHKLAGQADGLKAAGFEVDFIVFNPLGIFLNGRLIFKRSTFQPDFYFNWCFYDFVSKALDQVYSLYFIRHGPTTPALISWLKSIKRINKNSKIVIDMPTYPYDKEWSGLYGRIVLLVDRNYRIDLKKYVDYMLHSGPEKKIYNIPVIPFSNGIQLDRITPRKSKSHSGYRLLAVGKWQYWHGLDRLIHGMKNYVENGGKEVFLDIVGIGKRNKHLELLVQKYGMEQYVRFNGIRTGAELDQIFDQADIGVGTLGLHRKGVAIDSSLKHREYTLRGLPFILAGKDADELDSQAFTIKVLADDSPIDIDEIILFAEKMKKQRLEDLMQSFAARNLSWKKKMQQLTNVIFEEV